MSEGNHVAFDLTRHKGALVEAVATAHVSINAHERRGRSVARTRAAGRA